MMPFVIEHELYKLFRSPLFQTDVKKCIADPMDLTAFNYIAGNSSTGGQISLNHVRMLRSPLASISLPPVQRFLFVQSRAEALAGVVS
jgi:hypothetical protein